MATGSEIVAFSWGYWGWGSSTQEFVQAADALERARGFGPPVFVDARLRRSVRATGFREGAFERLIGPDRYCWMRGLGNKALDENGMELSDPDDVERLLELALRENRRRLIFFCACEFRLRAGEPSCHRSLVTTELVRRAEQRRQPINVVEWPGTMLGATPLEWEVPASTLKAVAGGRKSFAAEHVGLADAAGLAWATPVRLRGGSATVSVLVAPARFQGKHWVVPIITTYAESPSDQEMVIAAQRFRRDFGFEPEGLPPEPAAGGPTP